MLKLKSAKRKILPTIIALAAVLTLIPFAISAESDLPVSGDWRYYDMGDSVMIIQYIGEGGDVRIPSELDGKAVTFINTEAFFRIDGLTSAIIPASVKTMAAPAFVFCENLTSVTFESATPPEFISDTVTHHAPGETPDSTVPSTMMFYGCPVETIYVPIGATSKYQYSECSLFIENDDGERETLTRWLFRESFEFVEIDIVSTTAPTESESGSFTTTDALNILKSTVGSATLSQEQTEKYDVNGDDKVDLSDALAILKIVTGG